jgi:hypothetical protein
MRGATVLALALALCKLTGCVQPGASDVVHDAVTYDRPFNTKNDDIKTPKQALLRGYHQSFDVASPDVCVAPIGDARPEVGNANEDFTVKYEDSRRSLRKYFNLQAQAEADVMLVHARAAVDLSETLDSDRSALFFGLHAYQ